MKCEQNLPPSLISLRTYTSPLGGSAGPVTTVHGQILFEIIQEGSVYGFKTEPILHGEGSVFCHKAGQQTVSKSPQNSYYHCTVAVFESAGDGAATAFPRTFHWKDRLSMHRFLEEMLYAFHQTELGKDTIGSLVWSRLKFELEQFRLHEKMQAVHPQLRVATDFINANYKLPLSLENIADSAALSVSHLHMLFRDHLKESPHQYLIQKRMRVAGHTLVTSDLPIKAIAADVGYSNTENFCRAFRKFFDCSASEYRQAYAPSVSLQK